jgi:glycosyltransferase involved in cell wall biosynthesis
VPVVATRVGSVADVVHDGVTGLLGPCEPGELARLAARLLLDDTARTQMGRRARAFAVQRFGPERLVDDITGIYRSIAEERGWWPARQAREKEEAR